MAKSPKSDGSRGTSSDGMVLESFYARPDDLGLSLDELSQAYASLLGTGDDPYSPAPAAPDGVSAGDDSQQFLAGLAATVESLAEQADAVAEPTSTEPPSTEATRTAGSTSTNAKAPEGGGRAGGESTGRKAPTTALREANFASRRGPASFFGAPRSANWDPDRACEISPRTILEAMLFVGHPGNEPLTAKQIASLMRGVLPREIDELVKELNEHYEASGVPYRIESEGPGYRMGLTAEFRGLRDKFLGKVREVRLPTAAVDVLAIVAYNQPVGRDDVEKLRGKASGSVLNQLVRRGLLRVDLAEERGRRPLYYTTDRFLDLFHLDSLDDLPRSQDLDRSFS